jgi:asparagine synthase (glutamine-hydrolysing)
LPLLDRHLIEFAFSIPPRLKIKNGCEKYVLRKAVEDLLPARIVSRRKMGFNTPVAHWMRNDHLKRLVLDTLTNGALVRDYFRKGPIDRMIRSVALGDVYRPWLASAVWTVFVLQLWHDTYFNSQGYNIATD